MKSKTGECYETPKDVQGVIDEFEWLGIMCKSGEFRNGKPVYALTEFGKKFGDDNPGEAFDPAVRALIQCKLREN